jgi:hypothetical protein
MRVPFACSSSRLVSRHVRPSRRPMTTRHVARISDVPAALRWVVGCRACPELPALSLHRRRSWTRSSTLPAPANCDSKTCEESIVGRFSFTERRAHRRVMPSTIRRIESRSTTKAVARGIMWSSRRTCLRHRRRSSRAHSREFKRNAASGLEIRRRPSQQRMAPRTSAPFPARPARHCSLTVAS